MGLYLKRFDRSLLKQAQSLAIKRKQTLTEFLESIVKMEIRKDHFFINIKKVGEK